MRTAIATALLLLGILLMVGTLGGCYYDNEEYLYPGGTCDTANVGWSAVISPIVQQKCATPGCHVPGGTGVGDFTQPSAVTASVNDGSFRASVLGSRTMPPSSSAPLSNCELKQVQIWLDAGGTIN